ncbi:MAG: response regulator [Planctomycetes bacterium]|nr:response regulator [Planctomycetota bacterium]
MNAVPKEFSKLKRERILVIEDEPDISELITYNLEREGFAVLQSEDGLGISEKIKSHSPDLILLDLMLPGVDGIEIARKLKNDPVTSVIPIVIVTAKGEESDIVLGLGLGADDYVTKPFSPRELIARIKAVLRRGPLKEEREKGDRIVRDGLVIDSVKHEVKVDGVSVTLTATEFRLLHYLAAHPGRVFTRDQLMSRVIGEDVFVVDRNIDVHIRNVRKKIDAYKDFIETVRGVGYRFADDE